MVYSVIGKKIMAYSVIEDKKNYGLRCNMDLKTYGLQCNRG